MLPPGFLPGTPLVTQILPPEGCAGDTITVRGFNFNMDASQNLVTFNDQGGATKIPGQVVGVTLNSIDASFFGTGTDIEVIVPTNVRTGTVSLTVHTSEDTVFAGSLGFTACPQIVGVAVGAAGNQGHLLISDATLTFVPGTIEVYGFNLETVNNASFLDPLLTLTPADDVSAFTPPPGTWLLPPGMRAITVDIPAGIAPPNIPPDGCEEESFPLTIRLSAQLPSGALFTLPDLQVQYATGFASLIPASVTGAILPSGIRSGDITIIYSLYEEPTNTRYDLIPEFFEPASSTWLECDSAITGVGNGTNVVPGTRDSVSSIGAIIGPGQTTSFTWDSRDTTGGGLPTGRNITRIRLRPRDPEEENLVICPNTVWETGPLVIDNSAPLIGEIVEEFSSSLNLDPTADNTALVDPDGSGRLFGSLTALPFGDGTTDLVLLPGGTYSFNTNFGSAANEDPLDPQDLFPLGNPGDNLDPPEFWVRTIDIQPGANISVTGSNPLVFRVTGTGDVFEVVARFNSTINLNAGFGGQGTAAAAGAGGVPGPGGFAGGAGGAVTTDGGIPGEVTGVVAAERGLGSGGGGAGECIVILAPNNDVVNPKAGCGGGAGGKDAGENGVLTVGPLVIQAPVGRGGPVTGDARLTTLTGGGGGGGGGGGPFRAAEGDALTNKFGGGGGGGGGGFHVIANGSIEINGQITCDAGIGEKGSTGGGAAPGGGGSGGHILVQASGSISLASNSLLRAMGAEGGRVGTTTRGGTGSIGRVRIEANGAISIPGLANFTDLQRGQTVNGVSTGIGPDPVDGGTGADGSFNATTGTFLVNTATGDITGPSGELLFLGDGDGEYEFSSFTTSATSTLRVIGVNPFIVKVSGNADVRGVINLSGTDGGQPNVTLVPPIGGVGGAGGPNGGDGGDGGSIPLTGAVHGEVGGYPPNSPLSMIGTIPPIGSPDTSGDPLFQQIFPPTGGESNENACPAANTCYSGHGAGGGYALDGGNGVVAATTSGTGGRRFGNVFLQNPQNGTPLPLGGTGGSGGGGSNDGAVGAPLTTAGSGGGGAGGYFQLSVEGALIVGATAQILAEGGRSFQAPLYGGNGGSGAGGAIKIQGGGLVVFETDSAGNGPIVSTLGGAANVAPTADFDANGVVDYTGNGLTTAGGAGSVGRIRIESPIGFNTQSATSCGTSIILYTAPNNRPATGICPPPSVGPFEAGTQLLSTGVTIAYNVVQAGGVRNQKPQFTPPILTFSPFIQPAGTAVRVLFEGARESRDAPGRPGPFFGLVDDPASLIGADFLRMRFFMYASSSPIGVPALDRIEVPFTYPAN